MKYSSVLDDQQMSILITSIDFAELSSLENSIDSIQNLRTRNVDLFHQLLQNQFTLGEAELGSFYCTVGISLQNGPTPVLYTRCSGLLALLSQFEATEQHILVNPQLFSQARVLTSRRQQHMRFNNNLCMLSTPCFIDGQSKQLSMVESMIHANTSGS